MNLFTIDVEDWYQGIELPYKEWDNREKRLEFGLNRLLDILDEKNVKGLFFILGRVAEEHPQWVREITARGHTPASHGFTHKKVYDLSPLDFREEVRSTKRRIEDLTGHEVNAYRAPFFSITRKSLWALSILSEEGYTMDSSISPVVTWRYGIPGTPHHPYKFKSNGLIEVPPTSFRMMFRDWLIGGAYFRLLPYGLNKWFIRKSERSKHVVFYIHPWEYDPDHPIAPEMEWKAKTTHYKNLHKTAGNTRKLIQDFSFENPKEFLKGIIDSELPFYAIDDFMN